MWQVPDLTRAVPLDERRFRNQVMPVTRFREWDCYFDARAEDPAERLKALVTHPSAGEDPGALLMHRLRLDGFVYLESTGGPGLLATRPLFLRSGDVRLNVQAAHEVRVQVTDPEGRPLPGYTFADARPLRGDELFWTPRWRKRRLQELTRQVVCLEIRLHQARLYAVRGDFVPTIPSAARRFAETGTEPRFQPGLE